MPRYSVVQNVSVMNGQGSDTRTRAWDTEKEAERDFHQRMRSWDGKAVMKVVVIDWSDMQVHLSGSSFPNVTPLPDPALPPL